MPQPERHLDGARYAVLLRQLGRRLGKLGYSSSDYNTFTSGFTLYLKLGGAMGCVEDMDKGLVNTKIRQLVDNALHELSYNDPDREPMRIGKGDEISYHIRLAYYQEKGRELMMVRYILLDDGRVAVVNYGNAVYYGKDDLKGFNKFTPITQPGMKLTHLQMGTPKKLKRLEVANPRHLYTYI